MAPKKRKLVSESDEGGAKKVRTATASTSMRITRNMTTDGPRQAVFNTAELLEAVLLELSMKQLFTIRRVSQQFRDGVNTSVKLQEKMFLRPRNAEKEAWTLRTLQSYSKPSWMSRDDYELVPSSDLITNVVKDKEGKSSIQPTRANPLFGNFTYVGSAANRLGLAGAEMVSLNLECLKHPGSWQEMYLTDPPCTQLSVHFILHLNTRLAKEIRPSKLLEISHSEGLTVKALVDAIMGTVQNLRVYARRSIEAEDTSVAAIMSDLQQIKKKGHMIKTSYCRLHLSGMVLPTEEEWEEVRRKSKADEPEAA